MSPGATAGGSAATLKALPRSPGKPDQCEFPGGLQCLEFWVSTHQGQVLFLRKLCGKRIRIRHQVAPFQPCRLVDLVGGRGHDRQGYKPLPSFFPKRVSFFGPLCAIQAIIDLADIDGRHETLKTLPAGSLPEESLGDVSSRFILQPGKQGKRVKTDAHGAPHPHDQPHALAALVSRPGAPASVAKTVRALTALA